MKMYFKYLNILDITSKYIQKFYYAYKNNNLNILDITSKWMGRPKGQGISQKFKYIRYNF